ncbi:MAG TPA: class II glutamine amidotransferase [Burkholderiales bacterium]
MCRALLYLGEPVLLDNLLFQPDSALVRQSYMPKMLHLLNLAGFGMRAWDRASREPELPFAYASDSLPMFDRNLKGLAEKIAASCVLAHVRGVPYDTRVEIAAQNVHPFQFPGVPLVLAHNGELARFADMKPVLARHVKPELARHIRGTTDSEWIYALVVSQLENPGARPSAGELHDAVAGALEAIAKARAELGIRIASPVNLFLSDGTQLAAVRYCFDFGCYPQDPAEFVAGHFSYYSLWYTAGRGYGLHDGEWKMTGGSDNATSVLVASEPLTRDTNAWVEVPEYSMLHATLRKERPAITIRDLE